MKLWLGAGGRIEGMSTQQVNKNKSSDTICFIVHHIPINHLSFFNTQLHVGRIWTKIGGTRYFAQCSGGIDLLRMLIFQIVSASSSSIFESISRLPNPVCCKEVVMVWNTIFVGSKENAWTEKP